MKWLKNLVMSRAGRVKIMWTITFFFLVITFLTGLGQPILTTSLDRKLDELSDGQKNKPLYNSWEDHQRNIAKIQGLEYKDTREARKESIIWSWKWGIGFIVFFIASFIYTSAVSISETYQYMKGRLRARQARPDSGAVWKWIAVPLAVAATIYAEILLLRKGMTFFEKTAANFFAAARKIVKGVQP